MKGEMLPHPHHLRRLGEMLGGGCCGIRAALAGGATRWTEPLSGCSDELSTWPGQPGMALCCGQDPGRPLGAAGLEPESALGAHVGQRRAGHYRERRSLPRAAVITSRRKPPDFLCRPP